MIFQAQRIVRQPPGKILAELLEAHGSVLHALLAQREQPVACNPVNPGSEAAVPTEALETCDDPNENLLGSILSILRVPKKTQRHTVHVLLHGANHGLQGVAISCLGPSDFELETLVLLRGHSLIHVVRGFA